MRIERRELSRWLGLMGFWFSLIFVAAIVVQ
jgi:hypothetical protein